MAHAKFSASGSERWMNCPGSIALSEQIPPKGSSSFARLGTAAHALAETCLRNGHDSAQWALGQYIDLGDESGDDVKFLTSSKPLLNPPPTLIPVDQDMIDAVQVYLDTVQEYIDDLGGVKQLEVKFENKVDLEWLRPNMFGTADCSIAKWMDTLVIIDYKNGKGVLVEVEGNTQLRYYALGVAAQYDFEFEKVVLVVVQPRAHHADGPVRSETITMAELRKFGEALGEGYDRANEEDPMLNPGDWCKFCPAFGIPPGQPGHCEASWAHVQEVAKMDFATPPTVVEGSEGKAQVLPVPTAPEQLARAMAWVPYLDAWCKAVSANAEQVLMQGEQVPGFKLVQKRTIRKWNDFVQPGEMVKELKETLGLQESDFYEEPKLKTPPKLEKMLKKAGKEALATSGFVVKPDGALTMVKESDPRQAQVPQLAAASDFAEAPGEENE